MWVCGEHTACFRVRRVSPGSLLSVLMPPTSALFQTKTGIALLHDEVSGHAYDVRLKLTKEVLTIQKQDVICVSGSGPSANVSASVSAAPGLV